jgi:phosphoenolpyruvate synthase/pyruvate phosphate dikinase
LSRVKVVSLKKVQSTDEATIGPKAMSLARLSQLGFKVPAGFCITAAVFREHLEQNNLLAHLKTATEELAKTESRPKEQLLSALRQTIIEAPLSETIRHEIEEHYNNLGADYVAVRSSGTAEDLLGHSFAGQYDTYLGISNVKDCIEAVKKCWASLWTLRAYEYRQRNNFDHLSINMAVIVQSLIAADSSGVMFTVDPVKDSRSSIVIEACFGLGETLVSGKVTPDRFVVSKKSLKLLYSTISEKKIISTINRNGLVEEKNILDERASICCLGKKHAVKLAKIAKKIEAEFGSPQDIEWAIYNNKIFLLQSRPITALPPQKSWEDRQIWCCNPAKEVMPDVATPITLSVIDAMLSALFDPLFGLLCMDLGSHPIYGLVAGRVYFNANPWGTIFRNLPGDQYVDLMKATGSHKAMQKATEGLRTACDEDLPDMKFKRYRFYLKIPLIIIGMFCNTPKKGRRIISMVETENEKWSHINLTNMTVEEIGTCCHKIMNDFNGLLRHVLYLFSMIGALPILDMICNKWLVESNVNSGNLLAGVGGMVDATAGLDIWRLASAADSQKEVKELILSKDDWCTIKSKLSEIDLGRQFLSEWDQFMLRHGHHCRAELELYNKRWSETPDYILKFIRSHIAQMDKIDPIQDFAQTTEQRRQLEKQCRKHFKNPIKRLIFNYFLVRAQQGSVFRENVKSEVIKLLTAMRKLLLELGRRLKERNVLRNEGDIFFLRYEEIMPVIQGDADFDIHQVITTRRAEYDKNCTITPPDVVFGTFDPDNYVPDTIDEQSQELKGFGVSGGTATGKARVILRADTDEQLLAGEILVAPFTDPGWTPYFVPAAAIVMDEGGVISHGSIVAREYGIPAVVNVGNATKIIKTGQKIQVDGNQGVVRIL